MQIAVWTADDSFAMKVGKKLHKLERESDDDAWYNEARFKSTKKRFQIFFNFTKITISALFKFSFQFISFVTANNSNIAKNFPYALALELSNFDQFRAYEFISKDLVEASLNTKW